MARNPIIGSAFDTHQMNTAEIFRAYASELEFYRPRGFAAIRDDLELAALASEDPDCAKIQRICRNDQCQPLDIEQGGDDAISAAEDMLTAWAQRREGHDYIAFGTFDMSGDVGFFYLAERAIEDADWRTSCNGFRTTGEEPPVGASGLYVEVNDHGNVTAWRVSRGRRFELFACV